MPSESTINVITVLVLLTYTYISIASQRLVMLLQNVTSDNSGRPRFL